MQLIGHHQPDGLFLFIFVECRRQVLLLFLYSIGLLDVIWLSYVRKVSRVFAALVMCLSIARELIALYYIAIYSIKTYPGQVPFWAYLAIYYYTMAADFFFVFFT